MPKSQQYPPARTYPPEASAVLFLSLPAKSHEVVLLFLLILNCNHFIYAHSSASPKHLLQNTRQAPQPEFINLPCKSRKDIHNHLSNARCTTCNIVIILSIPAVKINPLFIFLFISKKDVRIARRISIKNGMKYRP